MKGTVACLLCLGLALGQEDGPVNFKAQRAAMKEWAMSLHDSDYNATHWAVTLKWQPANFFEHYAQRLSDVFKNNKATVNFALVGACDGTNDRTITDRFLPNEHWRGVFVEPFQMNYNDLSNFMEQHKVSHRVHLIHGAATRKCNESTIKMKRPTFQERNASLPHWMRRQIGAVVPFNKLDRKMTGESTIKMKRPTFQERNASLPHWMRRQIGAVVPFNKLDRKCNESTIK
eukprot:CAMPEP_0173355214 /NCGR_PEP_ID=MMETSP1144-20121109/17631_1 /TAXON_ID=483371 /ORGANISM="non described non described, Strain CCMP2298" /LENGTH=230 /DNA_ID=CAMNT_0014303879 /DNA_START=33 /DNA_END=722 /DNA_ORIENTATION=-